MEYLVEEELPVEEPEIEAGVRLIQQYGLEKSGTNYLYWLLYENFEEILVSQRYKHLWPDVPKMRRHDLSKDRAFFEEICVADNIPIPEDLDEILARGLSGTIVIYKDPYAYTVSALRDVPVRDSKAAMDTIDNWCRSNCHFLGWIEDNPDTVLAVKYEDLLPEESRNAVLEQIRDKFYLKQKGEWADVVEHAYNRNIRIPQNPSQTYDKSFQTEKGYLQELSEEEHAIVTDRVDPNLLEKFGYSIEENFPREKKVETVLVTEEAEPVSESTWSLLDSTSAKPAKSNRKRRRR